jgi:hypothetical protein
MIIAGISGDVAWRMRSNSLPLLMRRGKSKIFALDREIGALVAVGPQLRVQQANHLPSLSVNVVVALVPTPEAPPRYAGALS